MDELTAQNEELRQQLDAANALLEEKTNSLALKESQITELTTQNETLQQTILSSTNAVLQQRLNDAIASLEENTNLLTMKNIRIEHLNNIIAQQEIYCKELIKKQEQIISLNYTLLSRQSVPM